MPMSQQDEDILTTPTELAKRLKVSPRTLQDWRSTGRGPKWIRVGKVVRYRARDIQFWLNSQEGQN